MNTLSSFFSWTDYAILTAPEEFYKSQIAENL